MHCFRHEHGLEDHDQVRDFLGIDFRWIEQCYQEPEPIKLLVFQTSASGMDAVSIAREFGGELAFYGEIDVHQVLSFGIPEQVRVAVGANRRAFADCGAAGQPRSYTD